MLHPATPCPPRLPARPRAEALEPRLLHSADPTPLLAGVDGAIAATHGATVAAPAALATPGREIVFVDATVPDAELLLADLQAQRDAGRALDIVRIGLGEDGLAVIGQALAGRSDLAAVHVLAHGQDAVLQLGATRLDVAALLQRAGEIAAWGTALQPGGDLLLYGCELAQGEAGRQLLADLAALTGADVAASTDLTGAAAAGGNWTLEYTLGRIEAELAPSFAVRTQWQGVLATYTVTTTNDILGQLVPGSLRWAISQANANPGHDTIVFAVNGSFDIAPLSSGDDNNASGDFDIKGDLTIVGNGTGQTVIRSNGLDRVFDVRGATVTMSNLTIQGGRSSTGAGMRIDSSSNVTLTDVIVQNNVGNGGSKGGGIHTDGALTLRRVIIRNNGNAVSGDTDGAGIFVAGNGSLDARDVEIRDNVARGKDGGGLYIDTSRAVTLENVTIAGNAADRGGGIWGHGAATTLRNVTISGNSATDEGGGIRADRTMTLERVTIANNSAPSGKGGGVFDSGGGNVRTGSTLLAGNSGGNTNRALVSLGWNLSDDASLGFTGTGDLKGVSASLQPLANNGGFTRTHALGGASAAVNAANPALNGLDQRGVSLHEGRADIGAFEANPFGFAPTISALGPQVTDEDVTLGPLDFTVSDPETSSGQLIVTATSSNLALIDATGLVLSGSGSTRQLTLTPRPDAHSTAHGLATITVSVSDGGNVTSTSFTLEVRAVNDAPTIQRPATASVAEDQTLVFDGANAVQIADVDAGSGQLEMRLSVAHGTLHLAQSAGLAFITGQANGVAAMSFTGTLTAINNALATLSYRPAADYHGPDTLQLRVDDLGNSGSGGARVVTASTALTVTPVNDAPVLTLPGAQATPLALPLEFGDAQGNALRLADVDAGASELRLTLSTAAQGNGTIALGSLAGLTLESGIAAGDTTLVVRGTLADLNAALQTLSFQAGSAGAASITVTLDDLGNTGAGGPQVAVGSIQISVADDPPPVLTLSQTSLSYTENQGPLVLDPGLTLSDRLTYADPPDTEGLWLTRATVEFAAGYAGAEDRLEVSLSPASTGDIAATYLDGRLQLVSASGTATLAQWRAALRTVAYVNDSDAPSTAPRTLRLWVHDGISDSAVKTMGIDVAAVNDAPVLSGLNPLPVLHEDPSDDDNPGTLVSTLIAGQVSDPDAGAQRGVAIVGADTTHGQWQYRQAGDPGWSTLGAVSNGQALLLGSDALLRFVPAADWHGTVPAALTLRAWDRSSGNAGQTVDTGTGGGSSAFSSATASLSVTVTPVNDAPVLLTPLADATATQDQPFSLQLSATHFGDVDGDALSFGAAQADGSPLPAWLQFDAATRTFSGTPANGDVDRFTVRVSFSDGQLTAYADFELTVQNVNDPPVLLQPLPDQTATQDQAFSFKVPDDSFEDIDEDAVLSYSATLADGTALPGWLQFDTLTQTFSGTPGPADVATLTLRVTVSDGEYTASGTFVLTVLNVNDAPTGTVTISGTPTQGQVLTASNDLDDLDGMGPVSYEWFAGSTAVGTGSTLALTQAHVGHAITVVASYVDGHGQAEAVTSAATAAVANVNDAPTGSVTIAGTPTQGQVLTASNDLDDLDGMGAVSYEWFAGATSVGTGSTLTLTQAHVGQAITVVARYTDGFGQAEAVTSAATAAVANVNDDPTGSVTISGTPTQGQVLTASNDLDDLDGMGPVSYEWFAGSTSVGTGSTLTLTQAHVGQAITVVARYTDGFGQAEAVASAATAAVANVNDAPTGSVTIAGTPTQGQVLTASNDLDDLDGMGAVSYEWFAGATSVGTGSTLTLTQAHVGQAITVVARYMDGFGQAESVTSTPTAAVANVNDDPTGSVTISGTPTQGQVLTASNDLDDLDGMGAVSYEWFAGATSVGTGSTLTLTQAHVGQAITVVARYTDGFGHAEAVASAATAAVANVNDAPTGSVTIAGTPTQGQVLTASNDLDDLDGMGAVSYEWFAGSTAVGTGSTLTLTQAHVGQTITVVARYVDGFAQVESVTSAATTPVANVNDAPTGTVTISGAPTQGQVLTASNDLDDLDGMGAVSYEWFAGSTAVGTGSTLTLTQAHVGQTITVVARYVDGFAQVEPVTSAATTPVANVNDAPTGTVTISGAPTQGQVLTAFNDLADLDGMGPVSYEWFAGSTSVGTGSALTLTQAHVGQAITVVATYVDGHGQSEAVTSAATTAVTNVNDAPTGSVTIAGTPARGQTLTVSHTLADADGLGPVAYQWFAGGQALPGETGASLLLTPAHVGLAIHVVASYVDGFGQAEAVASAATVPVAAVNTPPRVAEVPADRSATEGETTLFTLSPLTFADDDGDLLRLEATLDDGSALPGWLRFDAATLRFSASPGAAEVGVWSVRVVASDAAGAAAETGFVLVVAAAPPAPAPAEPPPAVVAPALALPEPAAAAPAAVAEAAAEPAPEEAAPAAPALPASTPPADERAPAAPVFETAEAPLRPRAEAEAPPRGGSRADAVLAEALVPEFRALQLGGTLQLLGSEEMLRRLEELQRRLLAQDEARQALVATTLVATGGLSIGYVVWLVRGGVLLSSMLSALPAWQLIDPLPVVSAAAAARSGRKVPRPAADEEIERLFDGGKAAVEPTARGPSVRQPAPASPEEMPR